MDFDSHTGYLPPGIHKMDFEHLARRFGWNDWRRFLLGGVERACAELGSVDCRGIFVDGSFVTAKDVPQDWDGAYDPHQVRFDRLDPIMLRYDDGRRAMNAKYLGDIFPWNAKTGDGGAYLDFFTTDRDGVGKGVVLIELRAKR